MSLWKIRNNLAIFIVIPAKAEMILNLENCVTAVTILHNTSLNVRYYANKTLWLKDKSHRLKAVVSTFKETNE